MTLAILTGLVVFVIVVAAIVWYRSNQYRKVAAANLQAACASRSYHDVLMDKYNCLMSDSEIAEFNNAKWHD